MKGALFIFASAVCFASYGVWSRLLGHEFAIFAQGWVRSAIILLFLLPIAITKRSLKPVQKPHRKWFAITMICTVFTQVPPGFTLEWAAMFGYAAAGLGGFWLVLEGFKYVDASIGGLIGLLEIPLSVVLGLILFHDRISASVILGGAIIVASAVLPDFWALRHPKEKPIPPPPPL